MGSGVSSSYYNDVPISLYDGTNSLDDILEKCRLNIERTQSNEYLEYKNLSSVQQESYLRMLGQEYSHSYISFDGATREIFSDVLDTSSSCNYVNAHSNAEDLRLHDDGRQDLHNFLALIDEYELLPISALLSSTIADEETNHESKEILTSWDTTLSSVFLDISLSGDTASHNNYLGNYPAALCESVVAQNVCITFLLDYAPRRDNYISFGVAVYDKIPSAELGECFGKLPFTWGLVDRRNTLQPSEIWAEGNIVGIARSLQEKDEISYVLDIRQEIGYCKLYLNKALLYTFGPMEADHRYVLGTTICPSYKVTIIPRNAFNYGEEEINNDNNISYSSSDNNPINDSNLSEQQYNHSSHQESFLLQTSSTTFVNPSLSADIQPRSPIPSIQPPVPEIFPRDLNLLEQVSKTSKKKPRPENRCVEAPSSEADTKTCCICLENPKCVVLMPCKHLCVCDACGGTGSEDSKRDSNLLKTCPICRETIKQRIKVFM